MRHTNYEVCRDTRLERLERFIPVSKHDIITDLLAEPHWQTEEKAHFDEFCRIFVALYHYKFHDDLEALKQHYLPFSPDTDLLLCREYTEAEKQQAHQALMSGVQALLNNANYEILSHEALQTALDEASPYGVAVSVDLDDFSEMKIFFRGSALRVNYKRDWKKLFLFKKKVETPIYQRLFLLIKFKTNLQRETELRFTNPKLSEKAAQRQVWWSRRDLPTQIIESEKIFLKLFKDIPRHDVEMLFPNQKVRLKLFDKIKLAITGGGGTIGGIVSAVGKISIALANPLALLVAFGGLIGVITRQITNIFHQRNKYMMTLSQNLYFQNLDNNFGVINYLIDSAEEEECKEAILAYYFLLTQADQGHTAASLDAAIEADFQRRYKISIDFEIEDGLAKLRREGLILETENGRLQAVDLVSACRILDKQWDDFFQP